MTANMNDILSQLISEFKHETNTLDCPVAYVMRSDIYSALKNAIPQEALVTNNIFQANNLPGQIYGVQVFEDSDQEEECLEFQDVEALRLYLNRKQDLEAWGRYLVQFLPKKAESI